MTAEPRDKQNSISAAAMFSSSSSDKIPEVRLTLSNPIAELSNSVHVKVFAHWLFGCKADTSACKAATCACQSQKYGASVENNACIGCWSKPRARQFFLATTDLSARFYSVASQVTLYTCPCRLHGA